MVVSVRDRVVSIGRRVDGEPWRLRVVELVGDRPGPATTILAGILGDKPLGPLAAHGVIDRLSRATLAGTVTVIPAANLPALQHANRIGPDHINVNRSFPGRPTGFEANQFADALFKIVTESGDGLVDLHSGTATMALRYTYEYGDVPLAASFGYQPVVLDHRYPAQLCSVATAGGVASILPEFGGGALVSADEGIEGTLNVLRHRGHLEDTRTGPSSVPLIRDLDLRLASVTGILRLDIATSDVGREVAAGPIGMIADVATGEPIEEFVIERDGGVVLMAVHSPLMVTPGAYCYMVGFPFDAVDV